MTKGEDGRRSKISGRLGKRMKLPLPASPYTFKARKDEVLDVKI
jgi:hypothetical protein